MTCYKSKFVFCKTCLITFQTDYTGFTDFKLYFVKEKNTIKKSKEKKMYTTNGKKVFYNPLISVQ